MREAVGLRKKTRRIGMIYQGIELLGFIVFTDEDVAWVAPRGRDIRFDKIGEGLIDDFGVSPPARLRVGIFNSRMKRGCDEDALNAARSRDVAALRSFVAEMKGGEGIAG